MPEPIEALFFKEETNKMKHAMLDLETLDVADTAVILSIGVVFFDPFSDIIGSIGKGSYFRPNLKEQTQTGRTINVDTLKWWMLQSTEARAVFADEGTLLSGQIIQELNIQLADCTRLWAKGPGFDCNILRNFYKTNRREFPLNFSKDRCVRTVLDLMQEKNAPVPLLTGMVQHNAVWDCVYQIKQVQQCLRGRNLNS